MYKLFYLLAYLLST